MKSSHTGQRGQVVVIFALAATFIVGAVALGIDYGGLTAQHRDLQAFADSAATAGAEQLQGNPTPNQRLNARVAAMIYLRKNLRIPDAALRTSPPFTCAGASTPVSFAADLINCQLPSPYSSYTISIASPSTTTPITPVPDQLSTVSVQVSEAVAASFASVVGIGSSNVAALSVAQIVQAKHFPFALWSDGCVLTGNKLEIVAGDVYVDDCTIRPQSGGQAAFCSEQSLAGNGNMVLGPLATRPANLVQNQTLATCTASVGGSVVAMGNVNQVAQSIPAPSYLGPPPPVAGDPRYSCLGNLSTCVAATRGACQNGTVNAAGGDPGNCYSPGAYSTIGITDSGIANNLNPGVYYVSGDVGSACYVSTVQPYCPGVLFTGNTMNANSADVADSCWAAPNVPASGAFTLPCPDGFAIDPTVLTDPQCTPASTLPLLPPVFSLALLNGAGNISNSSGGAPWYVRVTAVNAMGESTSNEVAINVPGDGLGHQVQVTILPVVGATGYNIYGAAPAPGTEILNVANAPALVSVLNAQPVSGTAFPTVNTSSCGTAPAAPLTLPTGFHNFPDVHRKQNYGVTFVLGGKASICTNPNCTTSTAVGGNRPNVLLSPYCSSLPVTPCGQVTSGPNLNDGAFVVYSSSQGTIQTSGLGTQWGMSGTLFAPKMNLTVSSNAVLEVIPGQTIVHDVNVRSGNTLNPSFYYNNRNGALLAPIIRLLQ